MSQHHRLAAVLVDEFDGGSLAEGVYFGTDLWERSCEWARFHGIDPNRVPAGSAIVRRADRCQIRFTEFVFDRDGEHVWNDDRTALVHAERIEQGEAPPLAFPTDATTTRPGDVRGTDHTKETGDE